MVKERPIEAGGMKIPRPDKTSIDLFKSLVPDDPRVTVRPMFGNISAFVNGNMFFGLLGNDLFVRLSDGDKAELLKERGASNLEPVKGRPMKEYVIIPGTWKDDPAAIRAWVSRSLAWSIKLAPKKSKK
jgi:TfoX/Sxy family transcriptional regulator of competence genes